MKLLPLRSNLHHRNEEDIPFAVYTSGTENQSPITRLRGFSASQLFLTFSGTGLFRKLGEDNWDILSANTLLYIPAGLPHEYKPAGDEPWFVGYVTYAENKPGFLKSWGFAAEIEKYRFPDAEQLYPAMERIWQLCGPHYNAWDAAEALFSFLLMLKRLHAERYLPDSAKMESASRVPNSVVDTVTRFLHDHLQRSFTMAELSAHVGYSPKHLTRLFKQALGMTPTQYLQRFKLKTANLLLEDDPRMTVRQAAAYVGMEPVYFTRLFRRVYGTAPSHWRKASSRNTASYD